MLKASPIALIHPYEVRSDFCKRPKVRQPGILKLGFKVCVFSLGDDGLRLLCIFGGGSGSTAEAVEIVASHLRSKAGGTTSSK